MSSFYQDSHHLYRVPELDAFAWLEHGFGTRLADVAALHPHLALLKQVHSANCVAAEGRSGVLGAGDALVEDTPGQTVAVRTADCIPVLLVDERRRAVAAVHAGWRGTAAHIVQRAVETLGTRFGSRPEDLHAAIGPGIGPCCYEVGAEVAAQFGGEGRMHLDLPALNAAQLVETGVTLRRIYASNLCTKCRDGEFHSYRRDGEAAGRMYSFVGIRPAA